MVMETPTPQCVGREFVRQYYTMLNEAPLHLHRFYSHNSCFVHGGLDGNKEAKPVYGQQDIHERIIQLNFRDCHAKIRQVDAHATMADGVVVQVTGELSNNGQPMRRFMQTFVLAPQSPKKFYVHNDIFRYQDEVFSDEEPTDDGQSEQEEETDSAEAQEQTLNTYYEPRGHLNGTSTPSESAITPVAVVTSATPTPVSPTATQEPPVSPRPETPPAPAPPSASEASNASSWSSDSSKDKDEKEDEALLDSSSSEPKTFANLFKSGGYSPGGTQQPALKSPPTPPATQTPTTGRYENRDGPPSTPQNQRYIRPQHRGGGTMRGNMRERDRGSNRGMSDDTGSISGGDGDRRRPIFNYPDDHQVFVGNVPHGVCEDELKEHFGNYGTVVDIRIYSKPPNVKSVSGGRVPNYGFVAFDNAETVQQVLNKKPTMFRGDHRLNIEEKKVRRDFGRVGGGDGGGPPRGGGGTMGGRGGMTRGRGSSGYVRDNRRGGYGSGPRR